MKLLSFIIPIYNSAEWLHKCLDSVLNQDIDEEQLEIICINDGSPDNSADIVCEYQAKHQQTIVLLEQENQGPSGARNNGMRHATGKYLCFVDPDDFVESNVYGGLVAKMEEQRLDMLRFNYQIVDEKYNHVEKSQMELDFDYSSELMTGADYLANRMDIACHIWKYMYRTEIIKANGIWCFTGDYFDDTPWLPMVLMQAKRMDVCDTVAYDYMERGDSLVKAKTLKAIERQNDGFLLLVNLLKEEIAVIEGGKSDRSNMQALQQVELTSDNRKNILVWYNMMIAHSVVTLLTNFAVYDYASRNKVLQELTKLNITKLSSERALPVNKRKIMLFNISPRLMMGLIRVKNLIR